MTGLDKIVGEIKSDSAKAVSKIIDRANKEAEKIRADAEKEAADACEKVSREASVRLSASKSAAESAAALKKRRSILEEKQKLIAEVIEEAKQAIYSLPESEYFSKIEKMIKENATADEGTIIFNSKDLSRLPDGFEAKLNTLIADKGGKLVISKETRPMDGGFVLVYKGIDRNCSISSLFETNVEALQDKIQSLLF